MANGNDKEQVIKVSRETARRLGCLIKAFFVIPIFRWMSRKLVITDRRVYWTEGVLGKTERSVYLDQITDVRVEQGARGRAMGYGTVHIETGGRHDTEIVARDIKDPGGIREAIDRARRMS